MSAQDFLLRHFVQVSIAEVEAGINMDAPLDEKVRTNALRCPGGQMDQCPDQKDIVDLHMDGWHTYFSPSGKELPRLVTQLESKMKGKDWMISELRDTVAELADAVAKRERCAPRCQAKSEDQAIQHKKECERLHARVTALEAELVTCWRPPLKPILVLPSTSGYPPWQGKKDLSRRHGPKWWGRQVVKMGVDGAERQHKTWTIKEVGRP